jgi:hypothetical protein
LQSSGDRNTAVTTLFSLLLPYVDIIRANSVHRQDYFLAASRVGALLPDRVSTVQLTFLANTYRWESFLNNQLQLDWKLSSS